MNTEKSGAYVLVRRGDKYISFPESVKEILKTHSHIEFEFKDNKFAIIPFVDFIDLLKFWIKGGRKNERL